jgi:hypothetical protein
MRHLPAPTRVRMAAAMPLAVPLIAALAALACGPSFQVIYEGDQRFEHCYALDDNPSASLQDKSACWRDWMHSYTYGQTRDRVEYAAMRHRALSRVPALPTDEAMMEAAPGQSNKPSVASPAPTSAFAPPPKTMPEGDAGTPGGGSSGGSSPSPAPSVVFVAPPSTPSAPPSADCQDDCSRAWQGCQGRADMTDPKREACAKTYKTCMKGCFK